MSQGSATVPAHLQPMKPIVCGEGDSAVTVYPLAVRTSVLFCYASANLPSPKSPEDVCYIAVSGGFSSNVGRCSPA